MAGWVAAGPPVGGWATPVALTAAIVNGRPDGENLVELLLRLLLVRSSLREAQFLPGEGDHPPADVFAEPDLVGAGHENAKPFVPKGPSKHPRPGHKVWRSSAALCRCNGEEGVRFGTEFSTALRVVSSQLVARLNVPDRARTYNLRLRRPTLYPIELREQTRDFRWGIENPSG